MKPVSFVILLWCLLGFADSAFGQEPDIPALRPRNVREIGIQNALPTGCFEQMLLDDHGRMWLNTCGDAQRTRSIHLVQFDGYEGDFHDLRLPREISVLLGGIIQDSIIAGIETDSAQLFLYHIPTQQVEFYSPGKTYTAFHSIQVIDNRIFILAGTEGPMEMLEFADGQFISRNTITGLQMSKIFDFTIGLLRRVVAIGNDIWMSDESASVYRYNILTNAVDVFPIPNHKPFHWVTLINWNGRLVIGCHQDRILSLLSAEDNAIVPLNILPTGWTYSLDYEGARFTHFVYADDTEWLLVNCRDKSGNIHQLLINPEGKKYDYTAVVQSLPADEFGSLGGHDFTRDMHTMSGALVMAEVDSDNGIQPYFTYPARAMIQLNTDSVLCLTDGIPMMLEPDRRSITDARNYLPINPTLRNQIQKDEQGMLWFANEARLYVFNLQRQHTQEWSLEKKIDAFARYQNKMLMLSRGYLYSLDPVSSSISKNPFKGNADHIDGKPNQLVLRDHTLWIATSAGLWNLELTQNLLTRIPLGDRLDLPLLALCLDEQGMIWMGTEFSGVVRYDPVNHSIRTCDRKNGLSHNTVVGILDDHQGQKWISTFDGITVINDSMEIIARFNKEDGLSGDEGNRWAHSRMENGYLIFGSTEGYTVIDPSKSLSSFHQQAAPLIFCKAITYTAPGDKERRTLINADLEHTTIRLPAQSRSLQLRLGTTDYVTSASTEYLYKIDKPGYEWTSAGNQSNIVITNLPSGQYEIQIRALSAKGIWSKNIARVHLHAAKPFYATWWFFILCALPFLGYFILWFWRSRMERRHLEEEVRKRTAKIAAQTEELKQLDEAKTRIYTNITHEFRTPLTVIRGTTDMIEGSAEKKKIISRNADRLLNLVNQMLELSKLESSHLELRMTKLNAIDLLRDIFESFATIAESKDVGMHFYARSTEVIMDVDVEVMYRIVGNLLSNALKFTPAGGNIYVEISNALQNAPGGFLHISVRDTGIGIPEDKIHHIFNRFYQVDDTMTRAGEGTGIGLALTRELVTFLRGNISVESRPGEGSTFLVQLPITTIATSHSADGKEWERSIIPASMDGHLVSAEITQDPSSDIPVVLVVEDNPDVIHYLMNCLQGTYQVQIAMDGQEGVEKAIHLVPDLIISDVMMPVKDGIRLCEEVKQDEHTSHIPVILLTAKADIASRLEGLKRGADAYMAKPFEKAELLLMAKNLIHSRVSLRERYLGEMPPAPANDQDTPPEDAFMMRVNELVDAHLDDEAYGVMPLSHALRYSRAQVHNKIKALTGMSTSAYLQHRRMSRARTLLQQGHLNISEVAYTVGFRDPNYFSRVFKKEYGLSPTAFLHPGEESPLDT